MLDHICVELVGLLIHGNPTSIWDRFDQLANVILLFIALDRARFIAVIQSIVSQAAPGVQHRLENCCWILVGNEASERIVLDRNTKKVFQARMKLFVTDVQSFMTCK